MEIVAAVAWQRRGATTGIEIVAAGRNVARLLGRIAAIAEVVGHGVVGGRADVGSDVRAGAAVVPSDRHRRIRGVRVAVHVARTSACPQGTVAGPETGCNVSAVAAVIAADWSGLGGDGRDQQNGSEDEFDESFHDFCLFLIWLNGLHP